MGGDLIRVNANTLVLADVRRVDISRGRRSSTGRGAFFGLLGGLVGGYGALLAACEDNCVAATILIAPPFGGALAGLGIGAGIGSLIRTERWQRVSWP